MFSTKSENSMEKEENGDRWHFLIFTQCFSTLPQTNFGFPGFFPFLTMFVKGLFSSPEHEVLRVSYCDHSPSVVCHPFTFSCLHSSIYKYQPISTKLGQNIYDHKISDEFDYGSNRTKTSRVICP